jgi:WD40 repeat protein
MRTPSLIAALIVTLSPAVSAAQEPPLPPANPAPALVLDPGGSAGPVAALAFSPDSSTLYVGGADKQVRRFVLAGGRFAPADPARLPPLRVPIGPGNAGAVNAIALSPDGKWVAVAGRAPYRDEARFGDLGTVMRSTALSAEERRDIGVVYLFDPPPGFAGSNR